jgi:hypothetical protein
MTVGTSPVQRLDFVNCSIDTVSASLLRTLFRSSKHQLQHISFCDVLMSDDTVLEEMFDGLICNKTIHQLTLHRVALQERDYQALHHLLQTDISLTHVNLDRTILAYLERQRIRNTNNDVQLHTEPQQCGDYLFYRESGILSRVMGGGTVTTV